MSPRIAIILALLALALPAHAATYYVATTGNNANSGLTRSNAFATIQHALNATAAGDNVIVLAGTYLGARFEHSGTPGAPITLMADPSAHVVLNGLGPNNRRNSTLEVETWEGDGVVSNVVVEGLHVFNSPRYGIDARSTQFAIIRGNTVSNSFSTGIFTPFSYDLLIEGNTSCENGEHGIYHNNSSDRFVIRANTCYGNTHAGIHMNGDVTIPAPDGTPWTADGIMSFGLLENNLIHDNGVGGAGINMDGVTDTIVRNNVLFRTLNNSGIAIFQQDGGIASRRIWVVNNVISMAQNGGWCVNVAHPNCFNVRVFNNVLIHPATADGSIVIAVSNLQNFASDYNVVGSRFSLDNDSAPPNSRIALAPWQARGYDTHSIVATAADLFQDVAARDYRLKTNSPAIDRGSVQTNAPVDGDGLSRPLDGNHDGTNTWDIGAYEFVHPTADSDQDDVLDRVEAIAGTDATNAASYFRISGIESLGEHTQTLRWPGAAGRSYGIWHGTNLAAPLTLLASNVAATPPENVYTSPATIEPAGWYRLEVQRTGP